MNEPSASSPAPTPSPTVEQLANVLGNTAAWKILRVLADGSVLLPSEISQRCGLSTVSGQLTRLRNAGIVIAPRVKLYEIDPRFLADKENRVLDFGHCLLRLNAGAQNTA